MCDCIAPCTCSQCCVAPPGRRGPPGPAGAGASVTVYAGTTSLGAGSMSFVNSNGVSFGINGQTITGSIAGLTSQSNQALSGSNGSFTFQTATFGNLNGVSFYSSNGSLVASVAAGTQSNPGFSASGGSSAFQTLNFANSNGVTFSNSNGSVVASYTNSSWTVSDSVTSGSVARLAFTNLNGVTLSLSTGAAGLHTIAGSHNGLTAQSNQALSGSNGSFVFQTASFGNLNGFSFYTSNGSMVGSYTVPAGGGTAAFSASGGSSTFGTLSFANSNGLTFSNSNGSVVASYTVPTVTNSSWTVSDSATSGSVARLAFTNLNGVTLSLSTGAAGLHTIVGSVQTSYLTSQSNQALSAANGSFTFQTATFADSNGVSFSTGTQGIFATVKTNYLTSQSNPAFSASGGSSTFQTLNFANSNGITFSNSNGSIVANYTVPTVTNSSWTVSDSVTSGSVARLAFTNLNGVTLSLSTGAAGLHTIVGSVGAPVTFNTTVLGNQMVGAVAALSLGQNSVMLSPELFVAYVSAVALKIPVSINFASTAITSCQNGYTLDVGIYNRNATNSTVLTRLYSTSYTIAGSFSSDVSCAWSAITGFNNSTSYVSASSSSAGIANSADIAGPREFIMPISSLMTPGDYWFAYRNSSSFGGGASSILRVSVSRVATIDVYRMGGATNSTGPGLAQNIGAGVYSVTSGALPGAISMSEIYNSPIAIKAYILSTTA